MAPFPQSRKINFCGSRSVSTRAGWESWWGVGLPPHPPLQFAGSDSFGTKDVKGETLARVLTPGNWGRESPSRHPWIPVQPPFDPSLLPLLESWGGTSEGRQFGCFFHIHPTPKEPARPPPGWLASSRCAVLVASAPFIATRAFSSTGGQAGQCGEGRGVTTATSERGEPKESPPPHWHQPNWRVQKRRPNPR